VWQWGTFPSGKVFGSLNLDEGEELRWMAPYVVIDGGLTNGEYLSGPYWGPGRDDFDDKTCELIIRADGTDHHIHGEFLDYGYYWTLFNPSQLCFGRDPSRMHPEQQWVCKEIPIKWTWDGEETLGLVEISRRLGE
jgi:hypothetical protein